MKHVIILTAEETFKGQPDSDFNFEIQSYRACCTFLESFLSNHYELVILDIDLLEQRVIHVLKIIKLLKRSVPVILVLSDKHITICKKALPMGILAYLMKPVAQNEFHEQLQRYLGEKKLNY
ncbi:MAG: response regulator [Calditrichaceae bacterium]